VTRQSNLLCPGGLGEPNCSGTAASALYQQQLLVLAPVSATSFDYCIHASAVYPSWFPANSWAQDTGLGTIASVLGLGSFTQETCPQGYLMNTQMITALNMVASSQGGLLSLQMATGVSITLQMANAYPSRKPLLVPYPKTHQELPSLMCSSRVSGRPAGSQDVSAHQAAADLAAGTLVNPLLYQRITEVCNSTFRSTLPGKGALGFAGIGIAIVEASFAIYLAHSAKETAENALAYSKAAYSIVTQLVQQVIAVTEEMRQGFTDLRDDMANSQASTDANFQRINYDVLYLRSALNYTIGYLTQVLGVHMDQTMLSEQNDYTFKVAQALSSLMTSPTGITGNVLAQNAANFVCDQQGCDSLAALAYTTVSFLGITNNTFYYTARVPLAMHGEGCYRLAAYESGYYVTPPSYNLSLVAPPSVSYVGTICLANNSWSVSSNGYDTGAKWSTLSGAVGALLPHYFVQTCNDTGVTCYLSPTSFEGGELTSSTCVVTQVTNCVFMVTKTGTLPSIHFLVNTTSKTLCNASYSCNALVTDPIALSASFLNVSEISYPGYDVPIENVLTQGSLQRAIMYSSNYTSINTVIAQATSTLNELKNLQANLPPPVKPAPVCDMWSMSADCDWSEWLTFLTQWAVLFGTIYTAKSVHKMTAFVAYNALKSNAFQIPQSQSQLAVNITNTTTTTDPCFCSLADFSCCSSGNQAVLFWIAFTCAAVIVSAVGALLLNCFRLDKMLQKRRLRKAISEKPVDAQVEEALRLAQLDRERKALAAQQAEMAKRRDEMIKMEKEMEQKYGPKAVNPPETKPTASQRGQWGSKRATNLLDSDTVSSARVATFGTALKYMPTGSTQVIMYQGCNIFSQDDCPSDGAKHSMRFALVGVICSWFLLFCAIELAKGKLSRALRALAVPTAFVSLGEAFMNWVQSVFGAEACELFGDRSDCSTAAHWSLNFTIMMLFMGFICACAWIYAWYVVRKAKKEAEVAKKQGDIQLSQATLMKVYDLVKRDLGSADPAHFPP